MVRLRIWLHVWVSTICLSDKIMIEYSYPECTTSVIGGLSEFRNCYDYRSGDIECEHVFSLI
jgi:lanosterol synthase